MEKVRLNCTKNEAIQCSKSGLTRGDTINKNGGTNTFDITITYNSATTTQPTNTNSTITATIDYVQELGQIIVYDTYQIGDIINYPDSNTKWYVIKESYDDEDYVTLLKQTVLTKEEIGNNYSTKEYGKEMATMGYYWSSTCHRNGTTYGTDTYDTQDDSGCCGHNDYAESKVKEMLEGTYINTLGAANLKEIDGYKIRLITLNDLQNNLGYSGNSKTDATPAWVYGNYGSTFTYWTMIPYSSNSVWGINTSGFLTIRSFTQYDTVFGAVRPVINLYKAAID